MEIAFTSSKLKKKLSSFKEVKKNYGHIAKPLTDRLTQLKFAENMEAITTLPALNCHALEDNWAGSWAIKINSNWRLIFTPTIYPLPLKPPPATGIDFTQITSITIQDVDDYH